MGHICSMKENLMHVVTDTLKHLNDKIVKIFYVIPEFITEIFLNS